MREQKEQKSNPFTYIFDVVGIKFRFESFSANDENFFALRDFRRRSSRQNRSSGKDGGRCRTCSTTLRQKTLKLISVKRNEVMNERVYE